MGLPTDHWQGSSHVNNEALDPRHISTTTRDELQGSVGLKSNSISTLNSTDGLCRLDRDDVLVLTFQVFDHRTLLGEGFQGWNVVETGIFGQRERVRGCQEAFVGLGERHDGDMRRGDSVDCGQAGSQ
jgi:hypothetical protein